MRTGQASSDVARAQALRARLTGPLTIAVDGATTYWLEDRGGLRITEPAATSADALAAIVAELDLGFSVEDLVLACCLEEGSRYQVGAGEELVDAALAAAGRPGTRKRQGSAFA